jgi:hypothetical protein
MIPPQLANSFSQVKPSILPISYRSFELHDLTYQYVNALGLRMFYRLGYFGAAFVACFVGH